MIPADAGMKNLRALRRDIKMPSVLIADDDVSGVDLSLAAVHESGGIQLHQRHFRTVGRPYLMGNPLAGMLHIIGAYIPLLHVKHPGSLEGVTFRFMDIEDQVLVRGADLRMAQAVIALVNHFRFLPGIHDHQAVVFVGQVIAAGNPARIGRRQMAGNLAALRQIADFCHLIGGKIHGIDFRLVFAGVTDVLLPVRGKAPEGIIRHPVDLPGFHIGPVASPVRFSFQLLLHEEEVFVIHGEVLAGEIQLGVSFRAVGVAPDFIARNRIPIDFHIRRSSLL